MQNQRASFACTALVGTNKSGVLKPNADGYYTLVLGALNIFNSAGAYYPFESAKELFKESSSLIRRISNGALRGEMGHPRQNGMSMRDFMNRVMDIYEPNVCCHIRKVWLDYQGVKDERGRPVIAIMGEVKPSGPMGQALKDALDNPSENVCFSIRSITNDTMNSGVLHKHIRTIVTWDYVNEPGISVAKKWHSPALESLDDGDIRILPIHLIAARQQQLASGVSLESHGGVTADTVLEELGWDKTSAETGAGDGIRKEDPKLPGSASW